MGYARRTVDVTSSLPFQILIHYNWWVIFAYVIVSIATFIYKGTQFPYPTYLIGWEGSALALLMIIDIARLAIATKGNKSRNIPNMVIMLVLSAVVLIGNVYFVEWQTYVLRIDMILHSISLGMVGMEFIIGIFCILSFATGDY